MRFVFLEASVLLLGGGCAGCSRFDVCKGLLMSQRLYIFKRRGQFCPLLKRTSGFPIHTTNLVFSGTLCGKPIVGDENGLLLEYIAEINNWIEVQCDAKDAFHSKSWTLSKGCAINDSVYLLFGGALGHFVQLLQLENLKPSKTFKYAAKNRREANYKN